MHYFILALSQKQVTLYEVTGSSIESMKLDTIPANLDDAWKGLERQEQSVQTHSTGVGGVGFHGHGGAKDVHNQEVDVFARAVAHGLDTFLREHHMPLVLATVEHEYGLFKKYDKSGMLADEFIHGNHDDTPPAELKSKADEIVRPMLELWNAKYLEEYGNLMGTGRTSTDREAILDAAHAGKVDVLFVAEGTEEAEAVEHTRKHRGIVVNFSAEKMPEGANMAAILRL